jgi:hypothetical protein
VDNLRKLRKERAVVGPLAGVYWDSEIFLLSTMRFRKLHSKQSPFIPQSLNFLSERGGNLITPLHESLHRPQWCSDDNSEMGNVYVKVITLVADTTDVSRNLGSTTKRN